MLNLRYYEGGRAGFNDIEYCDWFVMILAGSEFGATIHITDFLALLAFIL